MIRQTLSAEITNLIREVLPSAVSDTWQSVDFTVFFPHLRLLLPSTSDNGDWEIIAQLQGTVTIQLRTDAATPIDPSMLMILLFEEPLVINPPDDAIEGDYTTQLVLRLNEMRDVITESGIVTELIGTFDEQKCFVLKRVPTTYTPTPIINEHQGMMSNG